MNILSKLNLKFNLLDLKHTFSFKFVFMKRWSFPAHFVSILMGITFTYLLNRPFPHSCKQRQQLEAWVNKI